MSASDPPKAREVIFEIQRFGQIQRVAAIDVATGAEVVIQAPASAAAHDVRALALAKLDRALAEKPQENPTLSQRKGKLV